MHYSHFIKAARLAFLWLLFALALLSSPATLAAPGAVMQTALLKVPGGIDKSYALAVQPDGKILAAGYAHFGTKQFALTRYNANGSVDTGFADGGTRLEWLGPGDAEAHAVGVQSTGKIVVAGFAVSDQSRFGLARFNADGSLDTSFGGGGAITTIGTNAAALAMALQADDKIVLGGWSTSGGNKVFTLARYDANSPTLDSTFGSGGIVVSTATGADERIEALAIQSDGKIVAAGVVSQNEAFVRRYNADGTLDTTFGSGGTFFTSTMTARGVAVLANGDILVAGSLSGGGTFQVARLTSAGALDTSFGVNGFAQQGTGGSTGGASALQVQSDGKIVVAGTGTASGTAIAVARFNADGSNDTGFGNSGVAIHKMTIQDDEGDALAILASGELVVAGAGNRSAPADCACTPTSSAVGSLLVGLDTSGAVDSSFAGGLSVLDRGSKQSAAFASAIQSDGKLVVVGLQHPTPSETDAVMDGITAGTIVRYNADGSLDTSFGTNGIVATAGDKLLAVALQGDGKIVAAGYADGNFQSIDATRIVVVRLNANGTPDSTFGSNGVAFVPLDSTMEQAYGIGLQSDGKIVVGGIIEPQGSFSDALFARLNPDGSMDTGFGSSGKVRVAMSTGSDQVNGIAIQPDGKIVGAGWGQLSGSQDGFGVVRLDSDGSLDTSFGGGGVVMTAVGSSIAHGNAIALQTDGRIVVGGQAFGTGTDDFALVRYNTDGSLDSAFGTGGIVTTDVGNHNRIFALTILPSGKITAAGEWATSFGIIQYLPSGAVDTSFGSGGSVLLTMNTATNDLAHSIVQRPDGNLWVAGEASGVSGLAVIEGDTGALATPSVSLASSANPSTSGQTVTFTATVSGGVGAATGTVRFLDGTTTIAGCAAAPLSGGSAACPTSSLSTGTHSITAQYSGDVHYAAATSSALSQAVNGTSGKSTPSVSLASSVNPAVSGQRVTFTAAVSGSAGTATGTVDFRDGGTSIPGCGAVALSSGSASCGYSNLAAGNRSITANYSGSASYNAASSSAITQVIANSSFGAPTLVTPTGSISTTTPTYTWNAVGSATSYQLLVQNTQGVRVNVTVSASDAGCAAGTGVCSTTPSSSLAAGAVYSWFVKAFNGSTASDWGGPMGISVSSGAGGGGGTGFGTPTLVSPSGTVSTTTPTYTWNAVGTATSYQLLVQNTQGVALNVTLSASAAGCGSGTGTCSTTPTTALTPGASYSWFVKAFAGTTASDWGGPMGISVSSGASGGGGGGFGTPTLVSPSGTVNTTTPSYTWNAVATATSYQLLAQNTQGVAVNVTVSAADAGCSSGSGTCTITPSTPLTAGANYSWFVKAFAGSTASDWGGPMGISVSPSATGGGGGGTSGPPAAPTLVSPSGSTTTMPTYRWNASAGAASYEILVQNTRGVAVDVTIDAASAGCGAGTGTCSATPSVALHSATAYAWFAKAANAQGTSAWSSGLSIQTQ